MLSKKEIIKICSDYSHFFKQSIKNMKYEAKGIFNSEMLLLVALTKHLNVNLIIESGRSRGQSTKIIAENFKDQKYKIFSIEFTKYSSDIRIAFERLKKYKNLVQIFGDSFKILPKLISEECVVLIDGPKTGALNLTFQTLQNPLVKAVFLHDTYKRSLNRNRIDFMFLNTFSSDDTKYIDKFRNLDKYCWIDLRRYKNYKDWGPYRRGNRKMASYFSTLTVLFNTTEGFMKEPQKSKLSPKKPKKVLKFSIKNLLSGSLSKLKRIYLFPIFYFSYEKTYNRIKKIDYKDFFIKWLNIIRINLKAIFLKRVIKDEYS